MEEQGEAKIAWAAQHMPVLARLLARDAAARPLAGIRLGLCLHIEAKTAQLARTFHAAGAEVAIAASNPLSTQDDVAAALAAGGVHVYARRGMNRAEYRRALEQVLDHEPQVLVDDGADLIALVHEARPQQAETIIGATEETTTGVIRLAAMEREGLLRFPVIAVNDTPTKFLFDNRHGTGQSVWDAVSRITNLLIAGKEVVVIGYGWCGKGVSRRAAGMGARVTVCEVDPVRANEALMDGFRVLPLGDAAAVGDIFISVTGCSRVLTRQHFERMRDGALLANAGHFDVEIDKEALAELGGKPQLVRPHVERFTLADGRRLYLLADGRLVNLVAGDGHPAEIMDMSFSLQYLAVRHLLEKGVGDASRVVSVPPALDRQVARQRLEALGVGIDSLRPDQQSYLQRWQLDAGSGETAAPLEGDANG